AYGLQLLRPLSDARDNGLGELARADLLAAHALLVDVVSVYAVLHRPQPGVVRALGNVCLSDVDEHHHRAEEKSRRVREVLSGTARRGAVYGLEHGYALAYVGRACETDASGDLRGHVREHVAV